MELRLIWSLILWIVLSKVKINWIHTILLKKLCSPRLKEIITIGVVRLTIHKIKNNKKRLMKLLMKCIKFRLLMVGYRCIKRKIGVTTLKIKEDLSVHRLNKIRILKNTTWKVRLVLKIFLKFNRSPMIKMLLLLWKRISKEQIS